MPCNSVRLTGVQLEACNVNLMMTALGNLKLGPRLLPDKHTIAFGNGEQLNCETGAGRFSTYRDVAEIKRAYSAAIVVATAEKFGWTPAEENTTQKFAFNMQ